jgi:beta-N-acetylhexosaminidase
MRAAATLAFLIVVGCGSGGTPVATPTPSGPSPTTPPPSTQSPPSPSPSPSVSCVQRVFAGMTEGQRVGQLFIVGLANDQLGSSDAQAIRDHHFGSVSFIVTTTVGVSGVRRVADAVQALVSASTTAGVRFYVAANQEGGLIQALRGSGFSTMPTANEQGTFDPSTLQADAKTWGRQLAAAGVNLNFAPVMDVVPAGQEDQNQPIGVLQRGYGSDPATVGAHGVAFLEGMAQAKVTTTAKHFPGLGRVVGNTDFTANVVDRVTTTTDPFLQSFQDAIDAKVPFVMVALATYTKIDPDHLAVFSPIVMQQMLRTQMGFKGVIVSDDIGEAEAVKAIPAGTRAVDFLSAGGDMIISKTVPPAEAMASAVLAKIAADATFRARVDDAVLRILRAKQASGLLPCAR